MKSLKSIIPFLILALILVLIPACATAEPEVTEEPPAEEPAEAEPEEEAVVEEEETIEEPEEETVEGEPELVWSETYDNKIYSVAMAPDGATVAVGEYLTTYTHLLYDGSLVDVNTYRHSAEDLEYSLDGAIIGVGLGNYGAVLTNAADGAELFQLHGGYNNRLAFSPDGEHIATGNRDGIVWIWQLEDGQQVASLEELEAGWVQAIDYHPSGNMLAVTHFDCTVNIWDLEEGRVVHTMQLDVGEGSCGLSANTFRFSPDDKVMAGAVKEAGDQLVRLWTVDGAEQTFPFLNASGTWPSHLMARFLWSLPD